MENQRKTRAFFSCFVCCVSYCKRQKDGMNEKGKIKMGDGNVSCCGE